MLIGTDIVKISRIEKMICSSVPERVFTDEEREYIISKKNRAQTAAGIFAVKEAFSKAVGTGISGFRLNDVSVCHSPQGAPRLVLAKNAEKLCQRLGICEFDVSITHDGEYAVAVVCADYDKYLKSYAKAVSIYTSCPENTITPDLVRTLLPKRDFDVHKGNCGRIYALAGSKGLTGAAVMACTSALKCGAGLITLGCCESLNPVFEVTLREVMTKPLSDNDGTLNGENAAAAASEASACDACLIGPGLGKSSGIKKIVYEILKNDKTYAVLDADALNVIAEDMSVLKNHSASLILTPHIGEFSRLTGINKNKVLKNTQEYAVEFAQKYGVTLILKSHRTVVSSPDGRCLVNISGNPGMATGGTGDVLAGAVTSFAAQGLSPFDAACAGVFIHSLAADMAVQETGEYSLTPSDIIKYLPYAVKHSTGR